MMKTAEISEDGGDQEDGVGAQGPGGRRKPDNFWKPKSCVASQHSRILLPCFFQKVHAGIGQVTRSKDEHVVL